MEKLREAVEEIRLRQENNPEGYHLDEALQTLISHATLTLKVAEGFPREWEINNLQDEPTYHTATGVNLMRSECLAYMVKKLEGIEEVMVREICKQMQPSITFDTKAYQELLGTFAPKGIKKLAQSIKDHFIGEEGK